MMAHFIVVLILQSLNWNYTATLLESPTGKPIVGATIMLVGTEISSRSDSSGWFKIGPVIGDTCRMKIIHADYNPAEITWAYSSKVKPFTINLPRKREPFQLPKKENQ